MEKCKLKEQVNMEIKERHQVKISNKCKVLGDFENNAAIDGGWEDVIESTIIGDNFNYTPFRQ
jgi:hypothetical protein